MSFKELDSCENGPIDRKIYLASHPTARRPLPTTGKPKGLVHTTAGYMLWAKTSFDWVFGNEAKDRYCLVHCRRGLDHWPHLFNLWKLKAHWESMGMLRSQPLLFEILLANNLLQSYKLRLWVSGRWDTWISTFTCVWSASSA